MSESVLVTAAGSIIGEGIIKCLKLANKSGQRKYEIIAADMSAEAPGLYRGDHGELLPSPDASNFFSGVTRICKKHSIRAIFIGSDEELLPLAKLGSDIERDTEAKVIVNPLKALEVGMDKWRTFELLRLHNLPRADSALPEEKEEFIERHGYPLVVKPRSGHGSSNVFIANNGRELEFALMYIRERGGESIIQEYLRDDEAEFTTGITVGKNSSQVISSITMRRKLKHGQTYKAFVEDAEPIRKSSEKVALALGGIGPLNVQSRLSGGEPKAFEINPRFSAWSAIRAVAGVNEPDIVFRDQVLHETVPSPETKELVGLRYWNEVYVPLDAFESVKKSGSIDENRSFVTDYF